MSATTPSTGINGGPGEVTVSDSCWHPTGSRRKVGWRELLLGGLLLLIATGICFFRWSAHPTDVLVGGHDGGRTDLTTAYGALRVHQRASWQAGQWPSWNAQLLCGLPVIGNPQSGLWYPPNWIFFLGRPMVLASLVLVLHHWLAGLGTWLLARRYGLPFIPSLLGGVTFLVAPFLVAASAEGHYNQTCLITWVPWTLLAYERLRSGLPGGVPLSALAIALCFFCGHAQETLYLVLVVSGLVLVDVARRDSPGRQIERGILLKSWILVGLLVVGLVAVDLLPIWFYTGQAVRAAGITVAQASEISIGPSSFLQLLDPFALGGPDAYRGPGKYYWETLLHFGVVPLLLAVFAVLARGRRYPVGRYAVLALASVLFALGDDAPLFPLLHKFVPGVSYFRAPSRALYFASFAVSVLAAFGLQALTEVSERAVGLWRRGGAAALAVAALLAGIGWGLVAASSGPSGDLLTWNGVQLVWPTLFVAGLLTVGAILLWKPKLAAVAGTAAVLLCLGEGTRHAQRIVASVPQSHFRTEHPVADFLQQHLDGARVLAGQDLLSDREANVRQIRKLAGLEGVPLVRLAVPVVSQIDVQEPVADLMGFARIDLSKYRRELLDLVGIRYAAVVTRQPPPQAGWKLVQQGLMPREFHLRGEPVRHLPYAIYEVEDPLPRAYIQGTTRLASAGAGADLARTLDPRDAVLVERDPLPRGPRQPLKPARIVRETETRIELEAELDAPGFLVLSDTYYPGWKAQVNGQPHEVVPVNIGFRGVALPAGRHQVQMTYEPPGLRIGQVVSGITLGWVVLLLFNAFAGRRLRRAP